MGNEEMILSLLEKMSEQLTDMGGRLDKIDDRLDRMDDRFEQIEGCLDRMDSEIVDIKETLSDHTTALNELLDWADDAQVVVKIPFGQIKEAK